ncbi:MAG: ROK family protein [Usitatibacter sp.]
MRIGIDLGGTKIELAAIDAGGKVKLRRRVPTPAGDYAATVEAVGQLIDEAERELGRGATVGVAMPGALSLVTGLVKNANSTCLNGKPLQQDLEKRLGRPVRLANDANCFALSESLDGAGAATEVNFGVILGTGVGGGLVVLRRVHGGANSIGGEWGHNPLPSPQPQDLPLPGCYCGRAGCIETYLSGPGMVADHAKVAGEKHCAEEIVARAQAGDAACEATLARYEERLARSLASVINILDPHAIVLGGGLSNVKRLYENVPKLWGRHVFSDAVRTLLLPPRHGDSSGVRGAAFLWEPGEVPTAIDGEVALRDVDETNIDLVGELRVIGEQRFHVASIAKSFWQVNGRAAFRSLAIYAGTVPVGYILLRERQDEIYLNRFLVDFRHQGRGYGSAGLRLAIEIARAVPNCNRMTLSYVPANENAARLYEHLGFRHTGGVDEDGECEMTLEFTEKQP